LKRYSNPTLVLACIAYMILPAIPYATATGKPQARNESKTIVSVQEINEASSTIPATSERKQVALKASRSLYGKSNNWSKVVETSKAYIGTPYASGGDSPAGFDCSGFVHYIFQKHGLQLPRSSSEMYKMGNLVSDLKPGDLVFFNTNGNGVSHVGIYIGSNQFISATNKGVKIDHLHSPYWGPKFLGAKRV